MRANPQRLRLLGYWNSSQFYDITSCVGWVFPQQLCDPGWKPALRSQLVAYLRGGAEWSGSLGSSSCRFDGCDGGTGSRDLTDGTWIWPEGLAHYVASHDVYLPDAFVETAQASGFTVPASAARAHRTGTDGAFWLEWAASQVPPPSARPGAISLEEAQALAASLSLDGCQVSIAPLHGRWLVTVTLGGGVACDLLPPCTHADLALHLHRWRRVPEDKALPVEALRQILDEVHPRSIWGRLRGAFASGEPIPTLKKDLSGWVLWSGTQGVGLVPTDEIGWRYRLSRLVAGQPEETFSQALFTVFGTADNCGV